MPWYSSWIPDFPNINFGIPGIQGRFVSFILKKTLGHLLKPGQLDSHQIDSQIGSGYVQINDLELSPEAINSYFHGLPIIFHGGTISSVKAQVPWPNPLVSTLGLSLSSLNLVFHVVPSPPVLNPDVDLTASVASVAESFIHEELSPREAVAFWQTLHPTTPSPSDIEEQAVPGGLDTINTTDDRHKLDMDPEGVSVFATLIERLLARFEFDVQDLTVTLIHPGNMSLTLFLEEIRYHTISKDTNLCSPGGESRTLSINGCHLAASNLDSNIPSPSTASPSATSASPSTSRPLSRISSSSSIDEETQFTMSQSLAFLPPKADPLSTSTSSSMYQSALSQTFLDPLDEISEAILEGNLDPLSSEVPLNVPVSTSRKDNRLLSFGSLPINIQLTTPSPVAKASNDDPFLPYAEDEIHSDEILQVAVSMGVVACALRPWHINGLMQLIQSLDRRHQKASEVDAESSFGKSSTLCSIPLRIHTQLRGLVFLLLPSPRSVHSPMADSLENFFDRCLVPPLLDCGYTRIHLDGLTASLVCFTLQKQDSETPGSSTSNAEINSSSLSLEFAITDMSIFFFSRSPFDNKSSQLSAFPLLLTDPHLATQYPTSHNHPQGKGSYNHLPRFDIIDWSEEKYQSFGTRLSAWRVRLPKHASTTSYPVPSAIRLFNHWSVTSGKGKQSVSQSSEELEVHISPMHIRLDLGIIVQDGGLLSFFEDFLTLQTQYSDQNLISSETTVDLPRRENNYQRAKPAVQGFFKDPDIHPTDDISPEYLVSTPKGTSTTIVKCPMVRISMRCPPPPNHNTRSGTLIIALNDISLSAGFKRTKPSARFAATDSFAGNSDISDDTILFNAGFGRAIIACSSIGEQVAIAFVSLGPLAHDMDSQDQTTSIAPQPLPLQPRVSIMKPTSKVVPTQAFGVDIPSVHIDISKPTFDALQYWADDVTQLLGGMSSKANDGTDTEIGDSRDTSLIGSRFFAKSRSGSGSALSTSRNDASAEIVVKLIVTETFIRLMLPRSDSDTSQSRPFDIFVSDFDVLAEFNSESKQQTILTVGAMDLVVMNTPRSGASQRFISLTSPRSLSEVPKSMIKLRLSTSILPEVNTKETRIKLTMSSFTFTLFPDTQWISDLASFAKNPPGTFEAVIPTDRTRIQVTILDGSIRAYSPNHSGAMVVYLQELGFSTDVIGDSRESSFRVNAMGLALLAADDISSQEVNSPSSVRGVSRWMAADYALLTEVIELDTNVIQQLNAFPVLKVTVDHIVLHLHLCADTLSSVTAFISDLMSSFKSQEDHHHELTTPSREPTVVSRSRKAGDAMLSSVEDLTFKRAPEVGPAGDMIYDDLPSNLDYLDVSFGAAAGLRELRDEDLDDFDDEELLFHHGGVTDAKTVSKVGGETIKIFESGGLGIIEDHFLIIPPEKSHSMSDFGEPYFSVVVADSHFRVLLYDGYDWAKTRKTIEEEMKEMRKKLARIRQLVASGQMQDSTIEDTSALLFNSVHIGLEQDDEALEEPSALIAAIDEELREDIETASHSSWQSLKPANTNKPRIRRARTQGKKLTRSKSPSIEFCISSLKAEFDQYRQDNPLVARTHVTVKDLEILDHIKTSTWKKFLTQLRSDSRGNVRETDSNMVQIELRTVRPVPGHSSEEVRLRAKILPLRLYVDQDAIDFLKKFFSFKTSDAQASERTSNDGEAYIQLAEIFPIDLKLDYKPRRVDYRALKEGRTIELMNFFHFDGAEMTLRHITLAGITGWPKLFEMLNDLWTPDVKATQLAEVISGVAPIRSIVNVGSGVADLILLPIAQYKKDGRIVRGLQKGATAFVKSTAIEAVKMGAKLATGTQVILEQVEGILGGQFEVPITAETLQMPIEEDFSLESGGDGISADIISKYAQQPMDLKEGIQSAVKSLQRNLSSAAQTILAVPMEVYERSGNEGPVRSVVRAVPIAVLKPMIGASEAVSKTLFGLHNTLDPNVRHDNEAKYK